MELSWDDLGLGRAAADAPRRADPHGAGRGARITAPPRAGGIGPVEERRLTERALLGDLAAWNALIERHNHRVVVTLLARGVRVDRAKDIAQDAWIRLIEQQRAGRLTSLVLPGLAIAQAWFLAGDMARRERGRLEPLDSAAPEILDPSGDIEERLVATERLARAERALARCSPSAQKVFRLAYSGDGLSHADVAVQAGLSLQRVRQILCEVRKRLRSALEDRHE